MQGRRSQHPVLFSLENQEDKVEIETGSSSEEEVMADNIGNQIAQQAQQRMKEFARPTIGISPSCIVLSTAARNYELKGIHFNMLPSFHGVAAEDPLTFMRDFYSTIQTFPLQGLTEDQLRMRCFPYTLKDAAKTWFMTLAPGSLTTWESVYNKFISKFYSHAKTAELRGKIATFSQFDGEAFHEAWERFKAILTQCPHHRYPLELLNQFFYDGLTQPCQAMVDNAAGGAMGEKTPEETYDLYEMLGANSQQKSVRGRARGIYEVSANTELSIQVSEMASQMKAIVAMIGDLRKPQATHTEVCSFCGNPGHSINVCPSNERYAGDAEQANALNFYNQRQRNDPFSNTYNPGWKNHPNFSWSNERNQNQAGPSFQAPQQRRPSLEETMQSFVQASTSRMDNFEASLKKLEIQVGQIAEAVQGHTQGKFPSQPEQAKAIIILEDEEEMNSKNCESESQEKEVASKITNSVPQTIIPNKMKDPGSFTIPCTIGNFHFDNALCDVGAGVNLMPFSVFRKLELGELKKTSTSLKLADGTVRRPMGIAENVFIKIDKFTFPADFLVLDMEEDQHDPIILGRPFLATGKALMDMEQGELTLRVSSEEVKFNMFSALKFTDFTNDCFQVAAVKQLIAEHGKFCQFTGALDVDEFQGQAVRLEELAGPMITHMNSSNDGPKLVDIKQIGSTHHMLSVRIKSDKVGVKFKD